MEMDREKLSRLLLELYANTEMKQRFVDSPGSVLKEKGFDIPDDVQIKVAEDTETVKHIVLPYLEPGEKPTPEELESRLSKFILL